MRIMHVKAIRYDVIIEVISHEIKRSLRMLRMNFTNA